jgi:N-acetylglutamate synthase-like GNAT family acetyltransferase
MSEQSVRPSALLVFDPDLILVRSFRPADRPQVAQLHEDKAGLVSVCCDCAAEIDQIEEKYFHKPHNHFWVAEFQDKIIGTVAIAIEEEEVAHLHCLQVLSEWHEGRRVHQRLVRVATEHAREHGILKLVLHADVEKGKAAAFFHRLGFEFSRHRELQGRPALEFYLNLYRQPELEAEEGSESVR